MPTAYDRLPLGALRVFEAVATHLSFSAAADALNVTPAAVSQQIKTLEGYIQVPLFRRSGRRVRVDQRRGDRRRERPGLEGALGQHEAPDRGDRQPVGFPMLEHRDHPLCEQVHEGLGQRRGDAEADSGRQAEEERPGRPGTPTAGHDAQEDRRHDERRGEGPP